ncbi:uncharacterized protein [Physcomitrium patens]|uniref:uncharacterized protein n=1 Tax=Physcomitrium patens TaxID=3218 RepID=UPI000D164839|nr:uncharacterized protein LOC112276190 [Physcomitrium patens]|eukprot:XP_024363058.1 uncharacterized protein LOC112276190 [Physcomitrella patens]
MRRLRRRKKMIGIKQLMAVNWNAGASSVPSYESFTIPSPHDFLSKETPGSNMDSSSLTGRKRPVSGADHIHQESSTFETQLQHALGKRCDIDVVSASQQPLDGCVESARLLQQAPSIGVKQIVVKLSDCVKQTASTSAESTVHRCEPVKDTGMEEKFQHETHRAAWNNATACTDTRQSNHAQNCKHPDSQACPQNVKVTPTVPVLHQALQPPGERWPKDPAEVPQKETRSGPSTGGDDSSNLPSNEESCCVKDSSSGQARSGFEHGLPGRSDGCSFSYASNSSWMESNNACRSCLATLPMNNQAVSRCHACVGTRFPTLCNFRRGVPRDVRYFVERASLGQLKCYPSRIEPPACCQRMDFEAGVQPPVMYDAQAIKQPGLDVHLRSPVRGSVVIPSGTGDGHTFGTHYIPGDDMLMCPAPWVHNSRIFPGVPAMCVSQPPKFHSVGVNYTSETSKKDHTSQPKQNQDKLEAEPHLPEMPDPVYPPAHCNNQTSSFVTDLDMNTQRQLEEQIAHEILVLSQKLANLQARYGTRRPVHNNSKPAVLSCPQTPLLLDNTQGSRRDVKTCKPRAPTAGQCVKGEEAVHPQPGMSTSRYTHRQQPDSRCPAEDRKLANRTSGSTNKRGTSTARQLSNRGNDSGASVSFNLHSLISPRCKAASGNSTAGSRASSTYYGCPHGATETGPVQKVLSEGVECGKLSNKKSRTIASPYRKRVEIPTEEVVEECSYSDDMQDHLRTDGADMEGYPNGSKRFDWVKTLRFGGAGVRGELGCADFASEVNGKSSSSQKEFAEVDPETWLRDSGEHECYHARNGAIPPSKTKSVQDGRVSSDSAHIETYSQCQTDVEHDRNDHNENRQKRRLDRSIKTSKRTPSPSPDAHAHYDEVGGLDSRLAHHLVKAGLRRAPSFWRVPGISRVPSNPRNLKKKKKKKKTTFRSQSPTKDGGRRCRRKTLFDSTPLVNPNPAQALAPEEIFGGRRDDENHLWRFKEEKQTPRECDHAVDGQWHKKNADYEAEYETFVENTDVRLHENLENEYTSVVNREAPTITSHREEDEQRRRIPFSMPTQRKTLLSEVLPARALRWLRSKPFGIPKKQQENVAGISLTTESRAPWL